MSPRITKTNHPAIETRDQVEAAVADVALHTHQRTELLAQMEQELVAVRERYAERIDTLDTVIAHKVDELHDWAKRNRESVFAHEQSIALTHGTLGFRKGMPMLGLVRGRTWKDVVNNLAILRLGKYIREILEPNKERILAEADQIGTEQLASIGVVVRQVERFFVEPKCEEEKGAA